MHFLLPISSPEMGGRPPTSSFQGCWIALKCLLGTRPLLPPARPAGAHTESGRAGARCCTAPGALPGLCGDPTASWRFSHLQRENGARGTPPTVGKINPRLPAADVCLAGVQPAASSFQAPQGPTLLCLEGTAQEDRTGPATLAVLWNPSQLEGPELRLWDPQTSSSTLPFL